MYINENEWSNEQAMKILKLNKIAMDMAIDALKCQHFGKWNKISYDIFECSECGQVLSTCEVEAYKFCHACGARMLER